MSNVAEKLIAVSAKTGHLDENSSNGLNEAEARLYWVRSGGKDRYFYVLH